MNSYRQGEALPVAENLLKIADYFGVSTDYLLGREGYEMEENK
jgi:transcriptional regulator with XRE-family HTH domain